MKIEIKQSPYDKNIKLYKYKTLELNDNSINVLIGHNGCGKSTMLYVLANYCKDNNIPYFKYDNYKDGGLVAKESYGFKGDFEALASTLFHSEGEQIFYNFGKVIERIGSFIHSHQEDEQIFILLDAMDSGLDVEGIEQIIQVFNMVCREAKNKIYIVITANNYAMIHNQHCVDIKTGKSHKFTKYEDFKEFIMKQYNEMRGVKDD